jgi:hypothetical protein
MNKFLNTLLRFLLSRRFIEIFSRFCLFVFHSQIGLFTGQNLRDISNSTFNKIAFILFSIILNIFLIYKIHYKNILKTKNIKNYEIIVWILFIDIIPLFAGVVFGFYSEGYF